MIGDRVGPALTAASEFGCRDRCKRPHVDDSVDAVAEFHLGALLQLAGRSTEAEAALRRADARGSAGAAAILGLLLNARGQAQEAAAAFRRADERGATPRRPGFWERFCSSGRTSMRLRRRSGAAMHGAAVEQPSHWLYSCTTAEMSEGQQTLYDEPTRAVAQMRRQRWYFSPRVTKRPRRRTRLALEKRKSRAGAAPPLQVSQALRYASRS